jgi:hypothetical protein
LSAFNKKARDHQAKQMGRFSRTGPTQIYHAENFGTLIWLLSSVCGQPADATASKPHYTFILIVPAPTLAKSGDNVARRAAAVTGV